MNARVVVSMFGFLASCLLVRGDMPFSLSYSTYLGGSAVDTIYGIATDATGNTYLAGNTFSNDFPTVNAFQGINRGNSTSRHR